MIESNRDGTEGGDYRPRYLLYINVSSSGQGSERIEENRERESVRSDTIRVGGWPSTPPTCFNLVR
jgi:hypothetical protein